MLTINAARLYGSIEALGRIGAYVDEPTGLTGVNRLALTDADGEGRRQVLAWMRELGLDVTVDRIGNVYARRAGREDTLPPVVIGSHIDSVPTAGRFDGCLGVLGGLEIVRTLHESNIRTRRPIVVAFFTDEEGSRFGTDMLGSAVATGRVPLESAYALRDRQGLAVRDELERIGFLGPAPVETIQRMPPHAYLECHIEQGPILRARERDIGVVTGVQAISWQELTITGKSAHAGTTPMHLRADAGVAAAKVNLRLREMIASGRYGDEMRATMGAIVPHPGMVNIVPGRALATVDLRNPSEEDMRRAEADLISYYTQVEREEKVRIEWRQTARTEPVPFDPKIQDKIAAAADALGLGHERIISGASSNPREHSTPDQCANGVNVLLQVVLDLAEE